MDLEEKVLSLLEPIKDFMKEGERVVVWTTTSCGCKSETPIYGSKTKKCHICGDKGFVFGAKTILP